FINTGLIIKAEHAGQLIGVIAHECGHISGGHIVKSYGAIKDAKNISLVSTILGAVTLLARPDVGGAILASGDNMANNSFMAFSRAIESSADLTALKFLDNIKISSRGFLELIKMMNEQELFASKRQDPYTKTHPPTSTRINDILHHVEASPWSDVPLPQIYNEVHQRIKAKLIAFIESDVTTFRYYKKDDPSLVARYAHVISYYRKQNLNLAISLIDELIVERPNDPYFHELKGQMLFENGRNADAIQEYKLAVKYLPYNTILREELAQVELESEDQSNLLDAEENLIFATRYSPERINNWRSLAAVYGRMGNETMVAASLAEQNLLVGKWKEALHNASKAMKNLKKGTPTETRMHDIVIRAEQIRDRVKK
ncbi:MAG: M48 family metalloprotease, partial [Rhodospirillaceae bacterium]|nr:M48 family metalloprotease [Rhodospirillaceae bacterium]